MPQGEEGEQGTTPLSGIAAGAGGHRLVVHSLPGPQRCRAEGAGGKVMCAGGSSRGGRQGVRGGH